MEGIEYTGRYGEPVDASSAHSNIPKNDAPVAVKSTHSAKDIIAIQMHQVVSCAPMKAPKLHRAASAHAVSSPDEEEDTALYHKCCIRDDYELSLSSDSASDSVSQVQTSTQKILNAKPVGPVNPSAWDLPPTTIRPKTLLIEDCPHPNLPTALNSTFQDYDDYETVGIGSQHHGDVIRVNHRTILLKANNPVAIYAFPLHGSIQIRGKGAVNARLVRNATYPERQRLPYSFNFGPLMDNLTIHSTAPLPKIRLDYHLYKSSCPQGFPRTLPPREWWVRSRPTPGFFKRLVEIEPVLERDVPLGLIGACFTIQPMNTLCKSFRSSVLEEHDERLGETVQWKRQAEWAVRVRIGRSVVQLAKMEDVVHLCPAALEGRETVA
jgi:hypothetical protein